MILLDTSVYIAASEDEKIELLLRKISKKVFIYSCEAIQKEVERSIDFLRKHSKKVQGERLKRIYEDVVGGVIRTTINVEKIADEYENEARTLLSKNKLRLMKDDLLIVTSATVAGIKIVVTFNRKTMTREEIVNIYERVNKRNKIPTIRFFKTREELFFMFPSF